MRLGDSSLCVAVEALFLNPMNQDASFTAPEILATAVEIFARGFGIDRQTATLMLLQAAGAVAGGSIRTTSPNLVECTPGFDIAGIHDSRPVYDGALIAAIDGVRDEIHQAMTKQTTSDRREFIEKRKRLMESNADLIRDIKEKEKRLVELRSLNGNIKFDAACLRITWTPSLQDMAQAEGALPELRQKQAEVERELADIILVLHPAVIRAQTDWRDFVTAGSHSFDKHYFQVATAESLLAETGSSSNQLRACSQLLQRSRSESPISGFDTADNGLRACVHLHGSEEEFAALLRHPRLDKLSTLKSFVYCENNGEFPANPDAFGEFLNSEWHSFIAQRIRFRATGLQTRLSLDRDGCTLYIGMREWIWEFIETLPMEHRMHFVRWPELAVRIATSLAMMEGVCDDGVLEARILGDAVMLLQNHAGRQAAVLARLTTRRNDTGRLDDQVERLVQRLRDKGPQTLRQLVRSFSGQNYAVIDNRIFEAIRRGRIIQRGKLYCLPDSVTVNASTVPDMSEINEGVNA